LYQILDRVSSPLFNSFAAAGNYSRHPGLAPGKGQEVWEGKEKRNGNEREMKRGKGREGREKEKGWKDGEMDGKVK